MKESASFTGKEVENISMNFNELREKGIKFIQNLSGEVWTDYNSHDPGITILEQVCYALTDVAYRTSLPVEDLLTPAKEIPIDPNIHAFFTPSRILSSHPVTINDMRKMIIARFEEIQNVWIIPSQNAGYEEQINGENQIEILPKLKFIDSTNSNSKLNEELLHKVINTLNEYRNIGEIYEKVIILQPQQVNIEFSLYINEHTDPERTIADLFLTLLDFIYCRIHYYSFDEMKEAGYRLEETFSGPRLKNGFIQDNNLKNRIKSLHIDEIQKLFSKVDGIAKCEVKPFNINGTEYKSIEAEKGKFFHLLIEDTTNDLFDNRFDNLYKHMTVYLNQKKLTVLDKHRINTLFAESWSKSHRGYRIGKSLGELFHNKLMGTFRNPEQYFSLQRHFPIIYGIGEEGLSQNESTERKAKALQLKAYLMLFEQHLANHLSQLGNLNEFFNIDLKNSQEKTYFTQQMTSIPDIEKLTTLDSNLKKKYLEPKNIYFDRKNRIYNHLLARFGEDLNEIPWKVELRLNMIKSENEYNQILLEKKSEFLMQLKKLSYNRTRGESYLPVGSNENDENKSRKPSGLEQMILAKTGIPERGSRSLHQRLADPQVQQMQVHANPLHNQKEFFENFRPLKPSETGKSYETDHELEIPHAKFGSISIKSLFRETLNFNNYRISKYNKSSDKVQVIFQKEKNKWVCLFDCASESEAVNNIHLLIDYFIKKNRLSEGIYIVDHILLSDFLTGSTYGFCFYDEYGSPLFHTSENDLWFSTPEARKSCLEKFFKYGLKEECYTGNNGNWTITDNEKKKLATYIADNQNPISKADLIKQTINIIRLFDYSLKDVERLRFDEMEKIRKERSIHDENINFGQRRLIFQRRLADGEIVNEDFFNFQITVLMPDWPARFQIERFKDYVTDLIHERIPAHIGNDILWLNVQKMKAFEDIYHGWENLKTSSQNSKIPDQELMTAAFNVYNMINDLKNVR